MCTDSGVPRRVEEWEKLIPGFAGIVTADEAQRWLEHENRRYRLFSNSILMSFLAIISIFYLMFKIVFFSFSELKEGIAVFALSFTVGFFSARRPH